MHRWLVLLILLASGCNLQENASTQTPINTTQNGSSLLVAWVDAGNLIVWEMGDSLPRRIASGGVVQPFIAPDGEHIAYTRGANGAPETLWVVDSAGTAEQQLVGERPRGYVPGEMQVGDVVWLDESIIYFNTLTQSNPFFVPRNDLYRTNIRTREVARILPPSEGGRIYPSPDGQWIVVVYPGTYGRQDGRIAVVDPLALREPRDLLYFVGVATGAERSFYPTVQWLPDSSAVVTAIPDADLIYSDTSETQNVPFTRLWHLPIDDPSNRTLLGTVQSSFFGLPRWSSDGSQIIFAQRIPSTNTFTINLASQNGETITPLYSGEAGTFDLPRWIPDSQAYMYAQMNSDGTVVFMRGENGQSETLPDQPLMVDYINADTWVFAAVGEGRIDLRWRQGANPAQYIGSAGATIPVLAARWINKQ